MTPRDRAVEVLVAHQKTSDGRYACLCGATAPASIFDGHHTTAMTPFRRWLAAHQVEMLAAAALLPDREEWGVQFERTTDPTMDNPSGVITVEQGVHGEQVARARVLPSVEDVAAVLFECLNPGAHWATALVGARRPLSVEAQVVDTHRTAAAAVLALFPDVPSREQVEREVAEKAWDEGFVSGFEECASGGQVDATEGNPYGADRLAAGGEA